MIRKTDQNFLNRVRAMDPDETLQDALAAVDPEAARQRMDDIRLRASYGAGIVAAQYIENLAMPRINSSL